MQSISKTFGVRPLSPWVHGLLDGWRAGVILIAALVAAPLVFVLGSSFSGTGEIWAHIIENLLGELLLNTFWLVLGVSAGTLVLGVGLAWLTSVYDFPLRGFFSWALMLPLAVPTYVLAFVFLGIFDVTGPVQAAMRGWFGSSGAMLPEMNSRGGVIAVMSLVLYPYVYLLTRNAFMSQGGRTLEASRLLGHGGAGSFFRLMLPMARPWIAGGLLLVVMETLADFGTVSIFNYDTFTTAIYKAWFGLFSLEAAAQLSSVLVVIVFIVLVLEQASRTGLRYTRTGCESASTGLLKLHGANKWTAFGAASTVFAVSFALPVAQLFMWGVESFNEEFDPRYISYVWHTLALGAMGALLVCAMALVLAYAKRLHNDSLTNFLTKAATLGYALPGTVLAVGIFIPVARADNAIIGLFGLDASSVLKGTLPVLVLAYAVRFMAVGFNALDSGLERISRGIDEAARLLGRKGLGLLLSVHVPLLRGGLVTASILVLVDIMKEMPITLMMRPFGWDTLAVKIFELTSEGEWQRAALSALALVAAGIVPVIMLTRHGEAK